MKKGAYPLRPGVQGFYITCDGGRERQASQEAVNVIDSVCKFAFFILIFKIIVPLLLVSVHFCLC